MKSLINSILTIIAIIFFAGSIGCGNSADSPLVPDETTPGVQNAVPTDQGRYIVGVYNIVYDDATESYALVQKRNAERHYNITNFIAPHMAVSFWVDLPGTSFVNVTMTNPSKFTAYDVRVILIPWPGGSYYLANADDYTSWFDTTGPGAVNGFIAYAKDVQKRAFYPGATHGEQFWIGTDGSFPPGTPQYDLVVSVSWPGNCDDPYEISNQTISNPVTVSMPGLLTVDVFDHHYGPMRVMVDTWRITGGYTHLSNTTGVTWAGTILNTAGASPGTYRCRIIADNYYGSEQDYDGETLYDFIDIVVQ